MDKARCFSRISTLKNSDLIVLNDLDVGKAGEKRPRQVFN